MEIKVSKTLKVGLVMDEEEVKWLLEFIQNSPYGTDEDVKHAEIRSKMFNLLKGALNENN